MAAPVTRRDFIKLSFTAGGALLVSAYLDACSPRPQATPGVPTAIASPEPAFQPNLYVKIEPDGGVTLMIHRSEMGQGVRTSLAMLLAEELEADWSKIQVEQMDAVKELNQVTSGSGSVMINYDALREAGATAREVLIQAAAKMWGVKPEECEAKDSAVIHAASGKRAGYGKLLTGAREVGPSAKPDLKDPKQFKLIGTAAHRVDGPDIVRGKAIYGLDVRMPGMLFATVARPPSVGGRLASYEATEAEAVPGVRSVVKLEKRGGVAVVAENTWAAIKGRAALRLEWDESGITAFSSESIRQRLAAAMDRAIAKEQPTQLKTIEAIYETPYLAHATMEPPNCVADVRSDHCDIWAPTQNPQDVQSFVQNAIGVPTEVHVTLLGGGFGRKLEVDYPLEAAEISQAVGAPVQVVWTREDDIQHDFYRQISYHWMRAGWEADGKLGLWRHYIAGQGINGIAYRVGKEVLDEGLEVLYDVPGRLSQSLLVTTPVPTGPWRGVMSAPNALADECFFDEMAEALGRDPFELRTEYLAQDAPVRRVLELAAGKANWGTPLEAGRGRGIAAQIYHQAAVAMVAEVSVENDVPRVHKVVSAINCGRVVNPDMVAQQVEGSIAFGLTSLLKGKITFEQSRVKESNFDSYPLLQLSEMPEVEVHIVPDERAPLGIGEMGVPPIVPAVLNALYQVTGKRIRKTPIGES